MMATTMSIQQRTVVETALDDDMNILQNVCSSYWDEIAEDYVDEAGRCLETIVSPPKTLALQEVMVDAVGVVGIQWDPLKIRAPKNLPFEETRLVVTFLRDGEIFASSPLSQPLQSPATTTSVGRGDERSAISDMSSLASSLQDVNHPTAGGSVAGGQPAEPQQQQLIAVWGNKKTGDPRVPVIFDSALERSVDGQHASQIDVMVHLVHCQPDSPFYPVAPLAFGNLRIEGSGTEKRLVADVPLHEPIRGQDRPTPLIANPAYRVETKTSDVLPRPAARTAEDNGKIKKKKKRGFAKLFSSRKKHVQNEVKEEEKKEEDVEPLIGDAKTTRMDGPISLANDAYSLDQLQGAFIRFKVDWGEKETNIEIDFHDSPLATAAKLAKDHSMTETNGTAGEAICEQDADADDASRDEPPPETIAKPTTDMADEKPTPAPIEKPVITVPSPKRTKKGMGMPFFSLKKKKGTNASIADQLVDENADEPNPPKLDLDAKRAAIQEQMRKLASPIPNGDEEFEMPPPDDSLICGLASSGERSTHPSSTSIVCGHEALSPSNGVEQGSEECVPEDVSPTTKSTVVKEDEDAEFSVEESETKTATQNEDDMDNETAHSIFDSVIKAVVGQKSFESESSQKTKKTREQLEVKNSQPDSEGSGLISIFGSNSPGAYVPAGAAFCHVMPTTSHHFAQKEDQSPKESEEIAREFKVDEIPENTFEKASAANVVEKDERNAAECESTLDEATSSGGFYAQFVQATSSLLGSSSGSHVEFKKVDSENGVSTDDIKADQNLGALSPNRNGLQKEIPERTPRRLHSSPVDLDKLLDDEVKASDESEDACSLPPHSPRRVATPSPAELSMERVLSWGETRQVEEKIIKSRRFRLGRLRAASSLNISDSSSKPIKAIPRSVPVVLETLNDMPPRVFFQETLEEKEGKSGKAKAKTQKNGSLEAGDSAKFCGTTLPRPDEVQPLSRKPSLKPPSSLPRNPREGSKVVSNARKQGGTEKQSVSKIAPSLREVSSSKKGKKFLGKFFRSKPSTTSDHEECSASLITENQIPAQKPTAITQSNASVFSDAETVEIDNVASETLTAALRNATSSSPTTVETSIDGATESISLQGSAFNTREGGATAPETVSQFSFFNMFGAFDVGSGPVNVDSKDVWLYAKDDDTQVTKETRVDKKRVRSDEDELTLIPSPGDVLLSETYHRCGPGKIADLGDAIIEETRVLAQRAGLLPEKSDNETFGTFTFDEPTFDEPTLDPSVMSADVKSENAASRLRSSPEPRRPNETSSRDIPTPTYEKCSPKGVADFGRQEGQTNVESFSEAFMNFITCGRRSEQVPNELFRNNDNDSLGELTLTTYEMQVEIEQHKKKIEQFRHYDECLDENGDEIDEDAALVFQPPSVGRRVDSPPFSE